MNKCKRCGSYAINPRQHGRDGSDPDLCDVCYWRKRAEQRDELPAAAKQTLAENMHLADGDDCPLLVLKRAVEAIEGGKLK